MSRFTLSKSGALRFVYSCHGTRLEADEALDDYFATGDIVPGESPDIVPLSRRGRRLFAVTVAAD